MKVLAAMLSLPVVHLLLNLAGFRRTLRLVHCLSPDKTTRGASFSEREAVIESGARCVGIAARHGLCRATCLRQSLVLLWTLRWSGVGGSLVIGVAKRREEFRAHAWVSVNGAPVGGQAGEPGYFTPILISGAGAGVPVLQA